jgi:hypothetical protein
MPDHPDFSAGEGLLRGARNIAKFIFGEEPTEQQTRSVYSMVPDLPIFHLAGMLAARPSSLARAITDRERAKESPQVAPSPAPRSSKDGRTRKRRR